MFFLCVPSFLSLLVSKNKYIYHLIIKTIIITIIILLGTFPARVVCPGGGVCWEGSRSLLKLSQLAGVGKLASVGSGVGGGAVLWDMFFREYRPLCGRSWAVSVALYFCENNGTSAAWTMPLSWPENNAPTFDNLYKKCYNKCNDDNKNVICHQTGKNAPTSRFAPCPYKIPLSRQKRRTAKFPIIWKYKTA